MGFFLKSFKPNRQSWLGVEESFVKTQRQLTDALAGVQIIKKEFATYIRVTPKTEIEKNASVQKAHL